MEPRNARVARLLAALAAVAALGNVIFLALADSVRSAPEAVLALAGAVAPTLAILVAWWAPSRTARLAMLVVAMLLELPDLVSGGSLLALLVEALLVGLVLATPFDRPASRKPQPRRLSIVF